MKIALTLAACLLSSPLAAGEVGTTRALILCGHPGDTAHRELFTETVSQLVSGMMDNVGFDPEAMTVLFGTDAMHSDGGPYPEMSDGPCTAEAIRAAADTLRRTVGPDDRVWVVVIGHSHFDGRYSWFNIPDSDLHQDQFAAIFRGIAGRETVFWLTQPASGFYAKPMAEDRRIVITATEADWEVNETTFPHAFARVLAEPSPLSELDVDADGTISLLDVYLVTVRRVAEGYQGENTLATEHAHLDDNADGRGTEVQVDYLPEELGGRGGTPPKSRPENLDGSRSAKIVLPITPAPEPPPDQPAIAEKPVRP